MRPIIGITTRLDTSNGRFYLDRKYAQAIEWAGGIPVYIPLITDRDYLKELFQKFDGLVLSGSDSDVDPARYGEDTHEKCGPVVRERDETDLFLLELAEEKKMPVLAICFGMQLLNVFRGGTLYQDIPSQLPKAINHSDTSSIHPIQIESDSLLESLAGSNVALVNTSHHQSVKDVGHDLQIIAISELDGIVEAMVDPRSDRFVLAVQWHPERMYEKDELAKAIFKRFIDEIQA